MKVIIVIGLVLLSQMGFAQTKDTLSGGIILHKDYRLDLIREKEEEANIAALKNLARRQKGYRLMILNTSDKDYAFRIRTELLQKFPEQKPYMWFANPYIRLKFGNFLTKEEAETYRRQISQMMGGATIYLLNETIEVNPGKDFDPELMRQEVLKQQ